MARITIRLDDEVHDRLITRAIRSRTNLSDLIRPALYHVADPGLNYVPTMVETQVALSACIISLLLLDIDARNPDLRKAGAEEACELLRRWGASEEVCELARRELEVIRAR